VYKRGLSRTRGDLFGTHKREIRVRRYEMRNQISGRVNFRVREYLSIAALLSRPPESDFA
jgi:hypothetical protein